MMRITILIIVFISILNQLNAQFDKTDYTRYYDKYYFDDGEKCYAFAENTQSLLIDSVKLKDDQLELNVLRNQSGVSNFLFNENGLYLPYDLTGGTRYYDHLKLSLTQPELAIFFDGINAIPVELIDTIQIIRRKPSGMWQSKTDSEGTAVNCLVKTPIEFIELRLLKSNLEGAKNYSSSNSRTKIEFRKDDLIARSLRRVVICPQKIDEEMIRQLNTRLTALGYLEYKKRTDYSTEIKTALIKFQTDQSIASGFIDEITLQKLKIPHSSF